MKKLFALCMICTLIFTAGCTQVKVDSSMPYSVENGRIVLETPKRPAGQQSALAMTAEPLDTVRVGFVGLGMRGSDAVIRYTYIDGVCITALCDLLPERTEASKNALLERGWPEPALYSGEEGWRELCENPNVDLVYICTPWQNHAEISVYAMQCGKHVAPGEQSVGFRQNRSRNRSAPGTGIGAGNCGKCGQQPATDGFAAKGRNGCGYG